MYDFNKNLEINEHIVYEGKKYSEQNKKVIYVCLALFAFSIILVIIRTNQVLDNADIGFEKLFSTYCLPLTIDISFSIFLFIKIISDIIKVKNSSSDKFYCITDKRILYYDRIQQSFKSGYLINYDNIKYNKFDNNRGDITMIMSHPTVGDTTNSPCIVFEDIDNPENVRKIIEKYRSKNLNNKST